MRIALVSRELVPSPGEGAGAYALPMARAWADSGHDVHVICGPRGRSGRDGEELRGVKRHTVTNDLTPEFDNHPFPFMRHAMGVYRTLCKLHDQAPFDYIEFPDCGAEGMFAIRAKRTVGRLGSAVLGVRLHTPTHECRALNEELLLDEESASLEWCEESAIREADIIVSPTRAMLSILTRRLNPHNPSVVIPYPLDTRDLAVATNNQPPDAHPTVLCFGAMERRTGVQLLIRAAERLLARGIDCRVRLIGAGPMRDRLDEMIAPPWRDRFVIEPPVSRVELHRAIHGVNAGRGLCCFPSLWENFPSCCGEAMSLGATVVGSDAGGMSEVIQDGVSGLLFRSGDVASLEAALGRGLADAPLRASISDAARERITLLCDPGAIVAQTAAAINSVRGARHDPMRSGLPAESTRRDRPPAVSIIVPFFNLSAYLPDTLRSIQAQTESDFEVILVDDGSTEPQAAPLVARVQAGEFGPVRIIRKDNGGLSSARNAGLAAARAPWVLPLDADDVLEPRFLEHALATAARDPGLGLITSAVLYFFESYPQVRGVWVPLGFARDLLCTTNCASSCTALIDRATLIDAGGYDAGLSSYEDWDLYCRLALRGVRATVIPEPLIRYRLRADSMMRTVGVTRRKELHAQLLARYPTLAQSPERAMRIILSRAETAEVRAREIIDENIRYRIADKVNVALKRTGVQRAVKGLASRVFGLRQESEP